jgi:hypothetical protein
MLHADPKVTKSTTDNELPNMHQERKLTLEPKDTKFKIELSLPK